MRRIRIVTWNVNGMRAALRKGFATHVESLNPDVLLLQEVRAHPEQLPESWAAPDGWFVHWHPAQRKGYAGTAIWSRAPLELLSLGIQKNDPDGRVLRMRTMDIEVASVYLPSGSSGEERQKNKERWMKVFMPWSRERLEAKHPVILGGDFNIAHTEKDIFYAKGNEKNSGFLPHERRWFSNLLKKGWNDFVRMEAGDMQGPYSWWSNRGQARTLDRGWRIDYLLGNDATRERFQNASIHRPGGLEVSDHAPVIIDLQT